jgi:mannitol/fructose-specific phosphotransferase system IIA component (Ntr-type)
MRNELVDFACSCSRARARERARSLSSELLLKDRCITREYLAATFDEDEESFFCQAMPSSILPHSILKDVAQH